MSEYSDWKIILDVPARDPKLGFDRYGQAFAEIILESEPRFAVGIFGGWGSGKTTLMNKIRGALRDAPGKQAITVDFSAWRYEKEEHLIIPLLDGIRDALLSWQAEDAPTRTAVTKVAKTLGGVTQSIVSGLAFKVGLPGAVQLSFDANKALKDATAMDEAERLKSVPRSPYFASFEALRKAFAEFADSNPDRRIVVFIDDLDRCLPQGALQVIESMKLFFDLPGFVFVVGLDRQVVEWCIDVNYRRAVGEDAPEHLLSNQVRGADYVKKIFQVPFTLSPVSTDQIDEFLDAIVQEAIVPASQGGEIQNVIRPHLDYLVTQSGINPRDIKRYINAYTLTMKTKPEGKSFDLNVVLAIQTLAFVPEWQFVYEALLGSRDLFLLAFSARVNGNFEALRNYDPNLAAMPPRLLEYVSAGEPGHALLLGVNIQDYIHLGAASLEETSETGSDRTLLETIGTFRDLRQKVLDVAPEGATFSSQAAAEVDSEIQSLGKQLVSLVSGAMAVELELRLTRLHDTLEPLAQFSYSTGGPESPEGSTASPANWAENINALFDETLGILSNYLQEGRARQRRQMAMS